MRAGGLQGLEISVALLYMGNVSPIEPGIFIVIAWLNARAMIT